MKRWTSYGLALTLLVGLGQTLRAQPAAPAVPATPTNNLWSFLCLSAEQREACKTKFCSSPLGKIFSSMAKPVGLMTGGLLGGCCPTSPTQEELAKLKENPESTEGAAAAIKKAEAEAKARRAAVRYLGTSNHSVTDVGLLLGYSTLSSFSRWFTIEFGKSPAAWRSAGAPGSWPPGSRRSIRTSSGSPRTSGRRRSSWRSCVSARISAAPTAPPDGPCSPAWARWPSRVPDLPHLARVSRPRGGVVRRRRGPLRR